LILKGITTKLFQKIEEKKHFSTHFTKLAFPLMSKPEKREYNKRENYRPVSLININVKNSFQTIVQYIKWNLAISKGNYLP
jgi:hypothetical protein